jgi:hypothetical protein
VRMACGSYSYELRHSGKSVRSGNFTVEQRVDCAATVCSGQGVQSGSQSREEVMFLLQAKDVSGASMRVGGESARLAVQLRGPSGDVTALDTRDNHDGTYSCVYTRATCGEYEITVSHAAIPIKGSPFRITVSAQADTESITCEGVLLETRKCKQGARGEFVIRCKDLAGAPLAKQQFDVSVVDGGGASCESSVVDCGDGSYKCSFTPLNAGTHVVSVQTGGRHVASSPYRCVVEQQLDRTKTVVSGLLDGLQQSPDEESFSVELFDLANVRMQHCYDQNEETRVTATLDGNDLKATTKGDGSYTVHYPRIRVGRYRVRVFVGGEAVASIAFQVVQKCRVEATVFADIPDTVKQQTKVIMVFFLVLLVFCVVLNM